MDYRTFSVDLTYGYHPVSPYAYCNGNPIKFVDPDGMDVVYFDGTGKEISRIVSNQRFESYYQVTNETAGALRSELSPLDGMFMQAQMPGLAKGQSYGNLDYQIAASTAIMNDKIATLNGLPATAGHQFTSDSQIPLLDVNLVKAIVMQESNMGAPGGNGTGASDPMQANYPGDWNSSSDVKMAVGLSKGQAMTPQTSINAGIGIFVIKGMNSNANGNYTTWKGNAVAVGRYNGGGNPNYVKQTYGHYNSIVPATTISPATTRLYLPYGFR